MNRQLLFGSTLCLGLCLLVTGCTKKELGKAPPDFGTSTGPVKTTVEPDLDANNFKVDRPERFRLATATEYDAAPELNVTGVVNPDVSLQVPVPSLATGRIVEIDARLGDEVKKGQLLFKVQSSDIAGAYSDYRKAVVNKQLAKLQLDRAKLLYADGAIPTSALEVAQNTEDNAIVDLDTTTEHLHLLGSDLNRPSGIVAVYAPIPGVITDQEITNQSGVQALTPPNPFTISDMARVWIVCDVYENELAQVHLDELADIRMNAYPDRLLKARIKNIFPIMDPNIRTAKVRLEAENPAGQMRLGMFVTATFHGLKKQVHAIVPATAILHLHDRQWVYVPTANGHFRRLEVVAGITVDGKMQEIISGLNVGDRVVENALVLQNTVEQ